MESNPQINQAASVVVQKAHGRNGHSRNGHIGTDDIAVSISSAQQDGASAFFENGRDTEADAFILRDGVLYAFSKRLFDIVVASLLLIVFSPVLLLIAIMVKLDSPGPIIFTQYRVGRGLRVFRFHKFRTMRCDARETHPEMYAYRFDTNRLDTVFMQVKGDPRVTRLGRTLRRTSLDELPNFWNVIKGDISLVGPRPEVPDMLTYYKSKLKFSVLPGVTGLAQISGRGKLNFLETVKFDEEYVQRRSFWYDVSLFLRTALAVFTHNNTVGH